MSDVFDAITCEQSIMAIKKDGTLWAWGSNQGGRLGDGTATTRLTPVQVMSGVKSVTMGDCHDFKDFSLAIKQDGPLWAWGSNEYGQLGDGTTTDKFTPVQVMSGVKGVAAGAYNTLAIKEDGTLWAWGGNQVGQLGDGTTTKSLTPVQIMSGVKRVTTYGGTTLAIKEDGTLWAWGWNQDGQLGDGTKTDKSIPVQVMSGVKSVVTGYHNTLAIKEDGTLWAWGNRECGQVGDGNRNYYPMVTPKQVTIMSLNN